MRRGVTGGALALCLCAIAPAAAQIPGLNCTIRPNRTVEVSAALPLIVAEVFVRPGQQVDPGQPLVRLDDTQLRAEFALAEARAGLGAGVRAAEVRLQALTQRVARLTEARARNAVSASELDAAQMELALAEVDMAREREVLLLARLERDRVQAQINATLIVSPVAGIVGEGLVSPGEAALPDPVVTLHEVRPLRVEAFVPTTLLAQVAASSNYGIRIGDRPQIFPVDFSHAAPQADLASNTISLFFTLAADDVLPGSRCMLIWDQS